MKKISLLFLLLLHLNSKGQNFHLTVKGTNEMQTKIIDSIGFQKKLTTKKLINEEVNHLIDLLEKKGYLESEIKPLEPINDSTSSYLINLKERTHFLHLYIRDEIKPIVNTQKDTLKIPFEESELYLQQLSKDIELKGFSTSKLALKNNFKKNNFLIADLFIELGKKRTVNSLVINGYDKFPKGHKKQIERRYKNQTFNQAILEKINRDFNNIRFISQIKYPEILFNTDSTKVYVFVEKKKNNYFDGFMGFGNADGKFALNGNIDVGLNNILNSGDTFSLKWRNDGKKQTNFNLITEFPYAFNSPIGIKMQLNIFKQDSTFQNSKINIDLSYPLANKGKIYLGYQSTESSDIQNQNTILLNDFNNYFYTTGFEFVKFQEDELFPEKTNLNFSFGAGKRNSKTSTDNQIFAQFNLNHNLKLNQKNCLYLALQNYFLSSNNYLTNELFRFGGIQSIRGFRENSLQANQSHLIITEYRYKFSSNFYIHSIIDYGYFLDKTTRLSNKPFGFGIGFGLLNKSGLFKIIYANGTDNESIIKLSNSVIHLSLKSYF